MMTPDELRELTGLLVGVFDADHIEDVATARTIAAALATEPILTLTCVGTSFKHIMALPAAAAALRFHQGPRNKGRQILLRGLPIELVSHAARLQLRELASDEQGNFVEIGTMFGVACGGCGETVFFDAPPEGRVPWHNKHCQLHNSWSARLLALEGAPTRREKGLAEGECLKATHSTGKNNTWNTISKEESKTNMWRSFVTGEWHCDGPNKLKRCDVCFKLTTRANVKANHKRSCTAQDVTNITFTDEEGPWPVDAYQRCPPCRSE